jgi:DNA polymerase-3 subunit gamma/tau
MALNCPHRSEDGEPCGECDSCERIWAGHTALDVVEIDAASNRGVDDARDLRERAMYAPSEDGRFKVYILDEAHMLTREAWNALLKILEEPPPRVVFVFATTEPQKIQQSASPILSRCQRFDFRRIGVSDITRRLAEVLDGEGLSGSEEALRTMARRADGGLRDALSFLDQVLALTGGEVSQEAVRQVMGLVEEEKYLALLDILRNQQHAEVFGFVEGLVEEGYDLAEFYRGLVDTFRALLRLRLGAGDPLTLGLREDLFGAFEEKAEEFDSADLVRMLAMVTELETDGSLRRSANPALLMEMLLLRLSYLDRTLELEDLLRALSGEAPPPGSPGQVERPTPGALRKEDLPAACSPEEPVVSSGNGPRAASLSEAWTRFLDEGSSLPAGVLPFLRAARPRFEGEDRMVLVLPDGPGLDRLRDTSTMKALVSGLGRIWGRTPVVEVEPEGGGKETNSRITQESVRQGRLEELLDKEPALEDAVRELDLELLE